MASVDWLVYPQQVDVMNPARKTLTFSSEVPTYRHPNDDRHKDVTLVQAAQGGSEEAVEALFRCHWQGAYRAAYLIVRDSQAAEDIAQEAFLAAIRALDRFDRRRPFQPWLHRIVVNRAIDHTRARALRREASADALIPEAVAEETPQLGDEMMSALAELPLEHRAVIVLRYLLDYTPGEIARMLDLPRGTVNSRIRRALDRLAVGLVEEAS